MANLRRIGLGVLLLLALTAAWIWWQRPRRVDMAAYVPADTLIYLEANSLPALLEAFTKTEAWQLGAGPTELNSVAANFGWLGRFAALTGLGPADKVALARAQVAVAVTGANLGADGESLKLKPQYALVAETHTDAKRIQPLLEQKLDAFAQRAYGQIRTEKREEGGVSFTTWQAADSPRRLVAAFSGQVVIIAPAEEPIRACLDAQKGARPSLAGNAGLANMRGRLDAGQALASGYVLPEGLGQLFKLAANLYAAPLMLADPRIGGAVNSLVPGIPPKLSDGLGWSARFSNGQIEDRYLLTLKSGLADALQAPFAAADKPPESIANALPDNTYSFTRYNFKSNANAWLGLNQALAGQLDAVGAVIVTRLLSALWQPYGIDEPGRFLTIFDEQLATARLREDRGGTVVLHTRSPESKPETLKPQAEWLAQWLGPAAHDETLGQQKIRVSGDNERGAANGFTAMFGPADGLRLCLDKQTQHSALSQTRAFTRAATGVNPAAQVVTFTDDGPATLAFLRAFATTKPDTPDTQNTPTIDYIFSVLPLSVSETRLLGDAFERRARSSFGLIGTIASQFNAID